MTKKTQTTDVSVPKKEKLLSKNYLMVTCAVTSTSLMNYFFASTVALHIIALGGLQTYAGILTTVYTAAAVVIRPVAGILSDKYGPVKMLIAGVFICMVCCVLYGLAGVLSLLFVIRLVKGLGYGMHSTCAGVVAASSLPKSRLAEGMGIFGMGSAIGQALAPVIAIAIIGDGSLHNFRLLFFVAAGLCALGTIADSSILYTGKRKKAALAAEQAAGDAIASREPVKPDAGSELLPKTLFGFEYAVFPPLAVLLLTYMGISATIIYITPFGRELGIGNPGIFFMASSVGMVISRLFSGRVADRLGNDVVMVPGLVALIVLTAALPYSGAIPVFLANALLQGLAHGSVITTFSAILFKRCSPARRGTASGSFFSAIDAGFALGAPLLGAIADVMNFSYMFWAAALLFVIALVSYFLIASDRVHSRRLQKPDNKYFKP